MSLRSTPKVVQRDARLHGGRARSIAQLERDCRAQAEAEEKVIRTDMMNGTANTLTSPFQTA